jgi:hypothetical protein
MQLIGALIFIGLLVSLLGFAVYLARSENPKSEHYGSWSNVLGPRSNGSAFDVRDNLNKEINAGRRQSQHVRMSKRSNNK